MGWGTEIWLNISSGGEKKRNWDERVEEKDYKVIIRVIIDAEETRLTEI